MVTLPRPTQSSPKHKSVERISRAEGRRLLDEQAQRYLQMSGEAFARDYRAGKIEDPHRLDVARVAILLPLVEE